MTLTLITAAVFGAVQAAYLMHLNRIMKPRQMPTETRLFTHSY